MYLRYEILLFVRIVKQRPVYVQLIFLEEINLEYSLEGLKLKFQYFRHLMQRAEPLEKILMVGKIEGKRRWGDRG